MVLRDLILSLVRGSTTSTPEVDLTSFVNTFTTTLKGSVPPPTIVQGFVLSDNGTWIANGSGGGGAVSSVSGGDGITASPTTGAVVVSLQNRFADSFLLMGG